MYTSIIIGENQEMIDMFIEQAAMVRKERYDVGVKM